jgi:hypothetical protein
VVLTDGPLITVKSADLEPGLTAEVTLEFTTAGSATFRVPVVDASAAQYSTITPEASQSSAG